MPRSVLSPLASRLLPALLLLALCACGDVVIRIEPGAEGPLPGGGAAAPAPNGATAPGNGGPVAPGPAKKAPLGLFDASPIEDGEVRGPMTYAYRPGPEGVTPRRGGVATIAYLQDIDSFNPFLSSSVAASDIMEMVFIRLMHEQPDYYDGVPTFTPRAAERWEIAPDNLTIRFWLREMTWADGEPLTSEDVKYSVQAAKDKDVAWTGASIVDFISHVEVHSPREFTVHYTLSQPYNIMDINDVMIVPKHVFGVVPFSKWRGYDEWHEGARKAAGGPWRLKEYLPNQKIELERNPRYWDEGKPYLDRVVIQIFGNMESMINALEAGQLDVMQSVQPEKAKRVRESLHLLLYTHVSRTYGYIGWNCKRFPFDDARVRRAMTHAIDRRNMVEGIFYGYAEVAAPFFIRSMWASKREQQPLPYDPNAAIALLEEAGWTRGADGGWTKDGRPFEFKVITNKGNPVRKTIFEYMQSDLAKIGVRSQVDIIDFNQMSEQLKRHNFESYIGGWSIATKIDPKPTWHSVSVDGRYNYVNFTDPRIDRLIDTGRILDISDPTIRGAAQVIWDEFQDILHENQPYTMVYEPRALVAVHKRFTNVRVPAGHAYDNIHEWWVLD